MKKLHISIVSIAFIFSALITFSYFAIFKNQSTANQIIEFSISHPSILSGITLFFISLTFILFYYYKSPKKRN